MSFGGRCSDDTWKLIGVRDTDKPGDPDHTQDHSAHEERPCIRHHLMIDPVKVRSPQSKAGNSVCPEFGSGPIGSPRGWG